ncbi:hypothetical protein DSM104299_04920 [Baekduia alba]|uniref:hypothetical protein n=1 Tax=Baekduia alba TaxID=2997333 RepID=UPI00233FA21C|nr:hypothetical protein [Baekduia alba]WCB96164.1 hypothetical protein DSM104299_04920 [Baekduia alba]
MTRRALVLAACLFALAPATARAAVDLPPPAITGTAGDNGWYVSPVTLKWSPTGETSTSGCDTQTLTADTVGATVTCTASNGPGDSVTRTVTIHLDQTPPTAVAASPARPPDAPPFYTAPVAIAWSGSDPTSGIAACTATTYAGPDAPTATPTGSCRDNAGNVSSPVALTFAYDATAPPLTGLTATANPDRTIALGWTTSPDAQTATVVRNPGNATIMNAGPATTRATTDGPLAPATAYTYTVTVKDAAGNATSASASATTPAVPAELASTSKAKAKAKAKDRTPTLRWKAQRRAKYYNFQLFRNGRKILSAWPTKNHYTLHAQWRFRGRTQHLATGKYRWYVWPGYGRRAAHRYGRLHAKGAVTIPKPTPR